MALFRNMLSQYKGVFSKIFLYWRLYGGWKSVLVSPYLHVSILVTYVCRDVFMLEHKDWAWFDICNSIIPNILGFTLGGYAILLAFGHSEFMETLAGADEDECCKKKGQKPSPFLEINGTFLHFIICQVVTLFFSIICFSLNVKTGNIAGLGFFLFIYSLSISLAAAFGIFELAKWYDMWVTNKRKIEINLSKKNDENMK